MRRISVFLPVVYLAAGIFMSGPLAAQRIGTVEVTGSGLATWFDDNSTLTHLPEAGLGGSLGLFVLPNLAIEGGASWTPATLASDAEAKVDLTALRGRLSYYIPVAENIYPFLAAGYTRYDYSKNINTTDDALTGMVGVKGYITQRLAMRMEAMVDYVRDPFNASNVISHHTNVTLGVGLSLDLGPGRSKDSDGDGVRDRDDACANTPAGVRVDRRGCPVDTDGDGVADHLDRCPGTPAGARVDATGCRVDSDGDGVYDENDRCANTPAGVTVNSNGCPVDRDGDGVADHLDRCPGTPAGARVDANGCRVDTDGDGVYDENDRCPDTPAGTEVDTRGCAVLFKAQSTALVLEGVTFETNSAALAGDSRTVLDRVAESLVANPEVRIRVVGHTDSTGSRAYNLQLSQRRAESVREYLASKGVATDRMEAVGAGPDEPVASNDTAEGRQKNRRVELVRIGG